MTQNQDLLEIVNKLATDFNTSLLKDFIFHKFPVFEFDYKSLSNYVDTRFASIELLGATKFTDNTRFCVVAIEHKGELSERSSKKLQFELSKKILRDNFFDSGFFVFYDEFGNFRFSLVFSVFKGTRREFSSFKRYTYFLERGKPYRTFVEALYSMDIHSIETIVESFSVEKVTKEFFEAYKYALNNVIIPNLAVEQPQNRKHSFAQLLLSRIMFIYFLQRKGWFKWKNYLQDKNYLKNLWYAYKDYKKTTKTPNEFYRYWLSSLFFGAFNRKSQFIYNNLPEDIQESFKLMPFLNGGLFQRTELDETFHFVPDSVFEWLFEPDEFDIRKGFLETYNFTIDESTPLDVDVAVDPEMIGMVYESLINEEERGESGIFYTPRVEIDLMCRLSLFFYLKSKTSVPDDLLLNFLYLPSETAKSISIAELKLIRKHLENVKIIDPAVGSASFLVGMMNILVELQSELSLQIDNRQENIFALKEKIIRDNLYGVDVKDWAVMVGELRLWLSLIIETDEKFMDIYTKPLLPNLSFKLRQGDSLIQEIADTPISLRSEMLELPRSIRDRFSELVDRKSAFFSGVRSSDLHEIKEIEKLERDIFKDIVQFKLNNTVDSINSFVKQISTLQSRKDFWGNDSPENKKLIQSLSNQIDFHQKKLELYQKTLKSIDEQSGKKFFLWEVDFIEVFTLNGGFDIAIGNPPYIRQELIAPPLEKKDIYSDDEWRKLKLDYKNKLIETVKSYWGSNISIDKKSDIYVYFYFQTLSLLRPEGIFCFINSNSWLDVGYGACLQEFLLKYMQPLMIIDNIKKRSFKQADVNTVIVFIKRPQSPPDDFRLKFVAFKKPFDEVNNPEVLSKVLSLDSPVFDSEDFRHFPKTKTELLSEGIDLQESEQKIADNLFTAKYIGNKWGGKYLRAPEIYFKILEKGKGKLVRLGDIAEVRFGIKTGANEFFYLKPIGMTVKEVVDIGERNPEALIPVRNGAGWEGEIEAKFLKPFLFSLKEVEKYKVDLDLLNRCILFISTQNLEKYSVNSYIEYGEKERFNERPSVKNRSEWYILQEQKFPDFVSNRFLGDRFGFPAVKDVFVCDVFFVGKFHNLNPTICTALINCTFSYLSIEVISRKTYGIGVAYIYGPEIKNLLLLKPEEVFDSFSRIEKIFAAIENRPIYSIFTELGFDPNKPIQEQEPNPLPDRKALDDIVFDALGLTEAERKEVYWAVAELVQNRLEKAKSV
ncbi:MAG: Eco57I restriction-modification methylase domain-containing protein [Ignavibacteria bacterium]|nr:Eco57I restriction-modification methylase domain-containing protein [Ignavibacteria bacterium]